MRVSSIIRAQSTDALQANFFGSVQVFELVDALQAEYHFRQIPSNQELLNPPPNQPANFVWSKKEIEGRLITIDSLQVQNFPNLATTVSVITRSSTDDAESVLADLIKWIKSTFGLEPTPIFPRTFQSQLEVEMRADVFARILNTDVIGKEIGRFMRMYGFTASPDFQVGGFTLNFDVLKVTNPPTLAVPFTFERRVGKAFDSKSYFSQAPLKTRDHEDLLELMEGFFA